MKKTIAPTPEVMEALGRAENRHGSDHSKWKSDHTREQLAFLYQHPNESILLGILDEQEKHRAVAARWPHLYVPAKEL